MKTNESATSSVVGEGAVPQRIWIDWANIDSRIFYYVRPTGIDVEAVEYVRPTSSAVERPASNDTDAPERIWIQRFGNNLSASEFDPREVHDNGKPIYLYVKQAAVEGLGVEAALSELREMFPDGNFVLQQRDYIGSTSSVRSVRVEYGGDIIAANDTLAEAMAAIRRFYDEAMQADIDVFQAGDY